MFRQSWYTKLFIRYVLRVERTPFYLRSGYWNSPRLKPLGDRVIWCWKATFYSTLSIAILTFLLLCMRAAQHKEENLYHFLFVDAFAIGTMSIVHQIRHQILIDRTWK